MLRVVLLLMSMDGGGELAGRGTPCGAVCGGERRGGCAAGSVVGVDGSMGVWGWGSPDDDGGGGEEWCWAFAMIMLGVAVSGRGRGSSSAGGGGMGIVSALESFSFANRSRSRASLCAFVMTVILIFFIWPASLSTSSLGLSVDGVLVVAVEGAGCAAAPFAAVADFFVPLGARGTASFFAGPRVFFTLRLLPPGLATLIEVAGLLVTSVLELPRTGTIRGTGGVVSKLSEADDTTVDAALRRRDERDCFPGTGVDPREPASAARTAGPATVFRLLRSSSSTRGGFGFRSLSPILVDGRSSTGDTIGGTDPVRTAWRSRLILVASALSSSAVQLAV
jgi:hypothetical protein